MLSAKLKNTKGTGSSDTLSSAREQLQTNDCSNNEDLSIKRYADQSMGKHPSWHKPSNKTAEKGVSVNPKVNSRSLGNESYTSDDYLDEIIMCNTDFDSDKTKEKKLTIPVYNKHLDSYKPKETTVSESKAYSKLNIESIDRQVSRIPVKLDFETGFDCEESFERMTSTPITKQRDMTSTTTIRNERQKREFTGSRGPAYFQAIEREFTFTGYDIMNDKDDPEDRPSTAERNKKKFQGIYCAMCKQLDIIPVTFIKNRLTEREIKISSRGLGPKGARAMAVALVNNGYVTQLDLSDNDLQAEGVGSISEMLAENQTITHLDLSENRLHDAGFKAICNTVAHHDILKVLKLSGTGCKDREVLYVKYMLDSNMYLRELNLSRNSIGDEGCKVLRKAIADNDTLEVLDLSWNHIRGKGAIAIADAIRDNRGLRSVNLAWNGFALNGTAAVAVALTKNNTLQELNMAANRIHAEGMGQLMKGLKYNNTLVKLTLCQNSLTSQAAYIMLQSLLNMNDSAVRHIDIWDIVVDERFLGLYDELKELRNLEVIYGPTLSYSKDNEPVTTEEDEFAKLDPRALLVKIMERDGLRIIDLFKRIDDDSSWSVTRQEFKDGIRKNNIPVTEKQLDDLIDVMDDDKNGEIDLREMIQSQREYKKKQLRLSKLLAKQKPKHALIDATDEAVLTFLE